MRYTTLIDISEFPLMYRNPNVRLCYLHLVLRSGFHDNDRDLIEISVRRLADDVGITVSAVRHALRILKSCGLIEYHGSTIEVKKWLVPETISPRPAKPKGKQSDIQERERIERQARLEESLSERQEYQRRLNDEHTTGFILFYEQKYSDYTAGDGSQLASLRRNLTAYLQQCRQLKRKPKITQI